MYNKSIIAIICCICLGLLPACTDIDQKLPVGIEDPKIIETEAGALSLARGAKDVFSNALHRYIVETAEFTDEANSYDPSNSNTALERFAGRVFTSIDARNVRFERSYNALQAARNAAHLAISMLHEYGDDRYPHLLSELYSLKAYSIVLLSELYCSGVPLSTIDLAGDYTYTKGYSTKELLEISVSLFDSALVLADDSSTLRVLATMGAARAQLSLGNFQDVLVYLDKAGSKTDAYTIPALIDIPSGGLNPIKELPFLTLYINHKEGGNGLDYRSSDPRVPYSFHRMYQQDSLFITSKYNSPAGSSEITVASTIEARLMEAEAKLVDDNSDWLAVLNSLRTDGGYQIIDSDTIWNKGIGGVENLPPLKAPETKDSSTDMLFRERAFWLFLSGHRQGDLRRLVRQYERDPELVYPSGYYGGFNGMLYDVTYGDQIVFLVPQEEINSNPLYSGCIHEGA